MMTYIKLSDYIELLHRAMPDQYHLEKWHPEDLSIAIEHTSDVVAKVLTLVDIGESFKWTRQSSPPV